MGLRVQLEDDAARQLLEFGSCRLLLRLGELGVLIDEQELSVELIVAFPQYNHVSKEDGVVKWQRNFQEQSAETQRLHQHGPEDVGIVEELIDAEDRVDWDIGEDDVVLRYVGEVFSSVEAGAAYALAAGLVVWLEECNGVDQHVRGMPDFFL